MAADIEGLKSVTDSKIRQQTAANSITPAIVADAVDAAFDFTAQEVGTRAPLSHTHTAANISDFTEAVQDVVGAFFSGTGSVSVTYNDANNTLIITGTAGSGGADPELIRDTIGAAIVGVGAITVLVNDAADTITIGTTATKNSTDDQLRDRGTHTGTQNIDTVAGLRAELSALSQRINNLSAGDGGGDGRVNFPVRQGGGILTEVNEQGMVTAVYLDPDYIDNAIANKLAGAGTGKPYAAKPAVLGYDDTDIVAWRGSGPLEYRTTADPTIRPIGNVQSDNTYLGSLAVGNFDLAAGYAQARVAATDTTNASAWADSPAFTATTGQSAPNLLPASENMNQRPPWAGYGSGMYNPLQRAPDGSLSAFLLQGDAERSTFTPPQLTLVQGKTYCFSGYIKQYAGGYPAMTTCGINSYPLLDAALNLATGTIGAVKGARAYFTDCSGQGPGYDGWFLFEVAFECTNVNQPLDFYFAAPTGAMALIWHWQVNLGERRSTYQPTFAS